MIIFWFDDKNATPCLDNADPLQVFAPKLHHEV
nr:MAG TPA: hypothetical protein [Caudoviricetes sp.]